MPLERGGGGAAAFAVLVGAVRNRLPHRLGEPGHRSSSRSSLRTLIPERPFSIRARSVASR